MLQGILKPLNRFVRPRVGTTKPRLDAEMVALPQADGSIEYRWQGGSIASIKVQFLEMLSISVTGEYFSMGPYNLKIVGYDEQRECYICELISTDLKAANLAWSSRAVD